MANNSSEFSQIIECVSKEGLDFLVTLLEPQAGDYIDSDGEPHMDTEPCEFSRESETSLWVHAFEGIAPTHRLIDAIQQYQIKFNDPKPVSIEWADTCDEPKVGQFGGGAGVIFRGISHFMTTNLWVNETIARLNK